jgi:DNA-binding transcriptional ArsR family regulator
MTISSYEECFIYLVANAKQNLSQVCYRFFSTLANPTRLAILELLRNGPKNVTEISEALNQEQSMISHNLKPLERCKFIFSEKRKKERFYYLNKETMEKLFKIFSYHAEKYCSAGGKCLADMCPQGQKKQEASSSVYLKRF